MLPEVSEEAENLMVLQNEFWFDILPSNREMRAPIAGKWLVFGPTTVLHALVAKIDALVESGNLPAAKVARKIPAFDPFPDKPCVLCAFTSADQAEKERVRSVLRNSLGLETTTWKSDEQTKRDWDTDGWLAIQAEINAIRKALVSGGSSSDAKASHQRIVHLSDKLRKQLNDHPAQLSEAQLSGLQVSMSELEAGVTSTDGQQFIQDRMRNLEAKVDEVMRSLQNVMAKSVDTEDETFVFVVMPFSEPHVDTFDAIARAMLRVRPDLKAQRVDQQPGAIAITDEIHRSIRKARLVVCDLSDERPNVYYELGFAKGIGRPLICIAREGTKIHFDAYGLKTLFFDTYRELEEKLVSEGQGLLKLAVVRQNRSPERD